MKILSSIQIQEADRYTIEHEPISSADLMERASKAFSEKFLILYPDPSNILVFCGTGNNGGDGLAIARLLQERKTHVSIFTIGDASKASADFRKNHDRLPAQISYALISSIEDFPILKSGTVVIDGLFGSGLSRPAEGIFADLINHINSSGAQIVSIDIASGLFADEPTTGDAIIRPAHTISFQTPKLAFFQPSLHTYVGNWHIEGIGLSSDFIEGLETQSFLSESWEMKTMIPIREKFDHKGVAGKLLIAAGSKGKMGAAVLAAQAAFRSGVGLLYVHSPKCGLAILQTSIPEAMVMVDDDEELITKISLPNSVNAVVIGPGLGTDSQTATGLYGLLQDTNVPLVLDADALNILAENQDWLANLPEGAILTPHPGEFKRLVGDWADDFDKLEKLRSLCQRYKLNVVLKGAYSAICDTEGNIYFNPTGNPGMATAGSGDVLTGIIGALLAQGINPINSLRIGVYLHGLSGDIAANEIGKLSMNASDIINKLPNAFKAIIFT